jgi:hypothetical protein
VPAFEVTGFLHAPTPVAQAFVDALWEADGGDLAWAAVVRSAVADAMGSVNAVDRHYKRAYSRIAYDSIVSTLKLPVYSLR